MISVIIVTYNSMTVLPACILSLEQCSNPTELEIIIVDNASSDGTWEWIRNYSEIKEQPFDSIRTIHLTENKGYAYANNRGLEIAAGDFLLLLNPDTVVGQYSIEKCEEKIKTDASIGAIGCRLVLEDGRVDLACHRSFPTLWNSFSRLSGLSYLFPRSRVFATYNLTYLDSKGSYFVDCLCGAFLMVSRTAYEHVGGLDEDYFMYGEDIDWCFRIKKAGYSIWFEGSQNTIHLKGGNGGKRSEASLKHFYGTMLTYYKKHHSQNHPFFLEIMLRMVLTLMFRIHLFKEQIRT